MILGYNWGQIRETAVMHRTSIAASYHKQRLGLQMATSNSTVKIPLTKGYTAIVDECDADLARFKWQAHDQDNGLVYVVGANHRRIHRMIMERILGQRLEAGIHVDHINGNGLDNRRENLRLASYSQNIANSKLSKASSTGYKGVSFRNRDGVFVARIGINRKRIFLGNFRTAREAGIAYNRAALHYFGEYARFNDIEGWQNAEIREILVPVNNSSGYRGVSLRPSTGKYRAHYRGREIGTFNTPEEAYEAYLKARNDDW